MCTYYIVFIHSSVNGHPSWFHILLQNMQGQMPLQHTDLNSFVYVPNRGVVGSHTVLVQVFWEPFIVIFHNRYANLHSYQECMRVPFSLYPHLPLLFFVLLLTAIFNWNEMISHCGFDLYFMMISGIEHLFIYLGICIFSWEMSAQVFAHGNLGMSKTNMIRIYKTYEPGIFCGWEE
jgi:hypothetical protein